MVNDLSMNVRKEATGLLGSLHLVSPKFLEQTLDKKLMSHLKVSACGKLRPFVIKIFVLVKSGSMECYFFHHWNVW